MAVVRVVWTPTNCTHLDHVAGVGERDARRGHAQRGGDLRQQRLVFAVVRLREQLLDLVVQPLPRKPEEFQAQLTDRSGVDVMRDKLSPQQTNKGMTSHFATRICTAKVDNSAPA